jgi:outer membrane receptor protein involved in Fe transport
MRRFAHKFSFLAIFLLACGLQAQTFRGGIEGTVTDSTGAAVAGAQVTVTNPATGLTRPATTSDQGYYFFNELPLGEYSVTASKTGFRTETATGVTLSVAAPVHVDLKLTPGQVTEKVEVTAEVPLVETTNNNQGGVIEARQAEELPVNGRDFSKLLIMVAGATGDPSGETDSPGSFGLFSANGNRGRANNYLLDGTDMNDGYRNDPAINEAGVFGTPATILPIDALAEIPVISGGEAEYGRNSGAIVNIVTKSGTNEFHGSLFEFLRNQNLDARNFFNPVGTPKNSFNNNQFGGSLGGPIFKDKTFFFVAYEGQREHGSTPLTISVPTTGDIADSLTRIGSINPVIANLLTRNPWGVPLPVGPAGGATLPVSDTFTNRVDSLIFKIDQNLRGNQDRLTGRYFFGDSDQSFPLGLTGGSATPGYNTLTPTTVHVLSLSYSWVKSPRLLIEFRGGWNRFFETFFPQDQSLNPSTIGLDNGVTNPRDFGLPQFRFPGCFVETPATATTPAVLGSCSNFGATPGINRGRTDQNVQFFNNYSFTTGRHNFKWGYEFRRTFVDQFFDAGYRGVLKFASLDDFLSGIVDSGRQATGISDRSTFENNHGFYAQDNWKLFPRLTLNLGLRWDYYGVIGEDKNRFSLFDPVNGLRQVSQLYPRDLNNFSPRVSFAWDVFGSSKTILRAGWGLFYDAFSQDFFEGQLPFNTFNPGPAYNAINPDPILFNFSPGTIAAGTPIFDPATFAGTDVFTVDQKIRTPYIQNFNVNIEQQLTNKLALQLAYVGSTGRKLFRYRDINQGTTDAAGNFTQPFQSVLLPSPPNPAGTTPFYVNQFESTSSSSYNSLQISARVRNWHGFTSNANYTYSHSIDNASDGQDFVPNATQPDNSFNAAAERANSNFDTRNRFSWQLTYEFPKSGVLPWLLSGWSVDSAVTMQNGQPFQVNSFESFNGTNEFVERPDIISDPFAGTTGAPSGILNLAAFAAPCNWDAIAQACSDGSVIPTGYHFGNEPRNHFVGPSYHDWDFSLAKNTKLTERVNMQLRVDFFNVLNHPNFANPFLPNFAVDMETNAAATADTNNAACLAGLNGNVLVPGCRGIGTGLLAITATPDVALGNPFLGGGGARNIQIGLKFTF